MPTLTINNKEIKVPEGITLIQACDLAGVEVPRFCYHEKLSIAGNCRMCLVEVEGGPPKPVASCAAQVREGMKVHTDSPMVKKAREGTMEFLLANHPLDCPICDQGGECDLQDQAYQYGRSESEFKENKRAVSPKNIGTLIKTIMTRCIHCTRCVRFTTDVAGVAELGAVGRGENMEITSYLEKSMTSELSGNVIDLCPVGALTSKPYAFKARSWELKKTNTIDVMDALGSNIRLDSYAFEVMRVIPIVNEEINEEWISDKTRFFYDGLKYQRLDSAYIKKSEKLKKSNFKAAFTKISDVIKSARPDEISAISGKLSSVNDIFALKNFMDAIGSKSYDCRTGGEALSSQDSASYIFNTTIEKIQDSDCLLLVGVNPRKDSPVLNARITQKSFDKNYKIAAIGVNQNITYKYQDLGNEVGALQDILSGKSEFSKTLQNSKKPLIIFGSDTINGEQGEQVLNLLKEVSEKYGVISENWNGFNFLSKSTGLINGLELGFDKEKTSNILDNVKNGKTKLLILMGADDDIKIKSHKNCTILYIGSHGDFGADTADIILPGLAFSEKNDIYVNLEGRPQRANKAIFGPEDAETDSQIIINLANFCKIDLKIKDQYSLEKELFKNHPNIAKINEISARNLPESKKSDAIDAKNLIETKDYDFCLTNAITRSSQILNKRSQDLAKSSN